ncbi:hypothetical protein CVD25_00030 [Bacillus canaveralius]|uniref:N-acetyltransferase domain-containing protein n=1 Tax=Bacillus canaveralius TaxID=1403243 RepID=A0A2N5GQI2_9BACI|nr:MULTISPECIES: hypothetical protein [Bacillus]PLR85130.1 hypothetical protein CU635_04955 [Bacillus canaveralius]PLR85485.1 hypothetical protein CVD23_08920 [Bacillus sp. V33-4]PLS00871.1 hypothetical protein CVD25_00030 [Bacillus canaveralius]RSK57510.1 hypothetical protein EJA13_00740 [Bacillus canaveralius]
MDTIVRCANEQDLARLLTFLEDAKLGTEGVAAAIDYFLLVEDVHGNLKATVGIEPAGEAGLLRSLVISEGMAEKIILMLFEQMLILARDKQLKELYLATNKQGSLLFFNMLGFTAIESEDLPMSIRQLKHVKFILDVDNSRFLTLSM